MKIGVNKWTMPPDWSLDKAFEAAVEAGFDTIEINVGETGELTPDTSEAEARSIAARARDAGIEVSSLSTGLGWAYPLTDGDPAKAGRGVANTEAQIRLARWMGLDAILCVPGMVTPDVPYDVAYERAQAALRRLEPVAAENRVVIGVENVWNKFLLSPIEMARFVDEIGSPWVQVYFDVGNVLVFGYPQQWIRILGKRIKKVHVKDFRANVGNITGFANPLQGDVPWIDVREAFADVGYDDVVTAEVEGYRVQPEIGLRHIAEALRSVFA
ncbi:MAG: sugar phosphate isomerase/epimerase [Chthonomonadales bacterium]|nr:sugar phosphate isomerase/epimerase [Chthonomonadales bacterium]